MGAEVFIDAVHMGGELEPSMAFWEKTTGDIFLKSPNISNDMDF